jgi:putative transcriptional regulator
MTAPACCLLAILAAGAVAPDARPRPDKGKFLVATRQLGDPTFGESVVLVVARDDSGIMGVIVNQPTAIKFAAVLPTSLLALVRAKQAPADSDTVFGDVRILTSRDAFERALDGRVPRERLRAFAGHAGWTPEQRDDEIARGDWFVGPATADAAFSAAPEGL